MEDHFLQLNNSSMSLQGEKTRKGNPISKRQFRVVSDRTNSAWSKLFLSSNHKARNLKGQKERNKEQQINK